MKDLIHERGKALENVFFDMENRKKIEQMREQRVRAREREELAGVCGISDEAFLDRLLDNGVTAECLSALVVVPLVKVAWADEHVAGTEVEVIRNAAVEYGIARSTPPFELVERWLGERPGQELFEAWQAYAEIVSRCLEPSDRAAFAEAMLTTARDVARAAGGILGVGPKTSKAEQAVLDELASAFGTE
jgi:hypothetical protein